MPTWNEIQEYARSKYKLQNDEENYFNLVWSYEDGRSQLVRVKRFTVGDGEEEWVEFLSVVGPGDCMPHNVALKKNSGFVVGALAIDGDGDLIMVHNAPLASLDPDEFERPLRAVARTADRLEEDFTGKDEY